MAIEDITDLKHALETILESGKRAKIQQSGIARLLTDPSFVSGDFYLALKRIAKIVCETINVKRTSIWQFSHDHSQLNCLTIYEADKRSYNSGSILRADDYPSYFKTIITQHRNYVEDSQNDPSTFELMESYLKPLEISSMMDACIMAEGKPVGVVCCEHTGPKRQWHSDEKSFLNTISAITGQLFVSNQRKNTEKALKESEERFRLLSDVTMEGIIIHKDGIAKDLNVSLAKLLGYKREELIGKNILELAVYEEDREIVRKNIVKDYAHPYVVRGVRKNGDIFFAEIEARNFQMKGREFRVAAIRDITQRKQAEAERESLQLQLLQAQKMETVGRLAGGVAHDMNNKLNVILGYAEFVQESLNTSDPVYDFIGEIIDAGKKSSDIIKQLLAFARKQTIRPKICNLNETIENLLKMLRRLIGENIQLSWIPGSNLWPVRVDPSQIDQILVNLCINARDAISNVGNVTIETDNVVCDKERCFLHIGVNPGEFVILAVRDNGCGMTPEVLEQLYEPFFTTKPVGMGTGLGLPTVYGIVKQNNGFIDVFSKPGKGTTFKIYLPRHLGPVNEILVKDDGQIPEGNHETILLVEDEPSIIKMCQLVLEKLGYVVLSAHTPAEALDLAQKHPGKIHLLLTDVIMPEINGRDLSDQIHRLFPNIKTLFMSGYPASVIAHHGVVDKKVHFIQKPFSKKDIAVKIRRVLKPQQ